MKQSDKRDVEEGMRQLSEMTVKELLREEEDAMLDMAEATGFNDDVNSRRKARYLDKIVAELETRGVVRD